MSRIRGRVERLRSRPVWLLALLVMGCASSRLDEGSSGTVGEADASSGAVAREAAPAAEPAPPAAQPAAQPASTPVDAYLSDEAALKRGSQLFRAVCTGYCHSSEGAGRDAPDVFDCRSAHGTSDADVFSVVSSGVPDTQMQGFGGKLPDADLWRIVAFIRSRTTC